MRAGKQQFNTACCMALLIVSQIPGYLCAAEQNPVVQIKEIRFLTQGNSTKVVLELSGKFTFETDKLENPDRLFFDLNSTKPDKETKSFISVRDGRLKQIRVGESKPKVTRVVLDLEKGTKYTTSVLEKPYRLIVEISSASAVAPETSSYKPGVELTEPAPPLAVPVRAKKNTPRALVPPDAYLRKASISPRTTLVPTPPTVSAANSQEFDWRKQKLFLKHPNLPAYKAMAKAAGKKLEEPRKQAPSRNAENMISSAVAAKRTAAGADSLTRALGLKIRRIVIDPGHGGHDQGSSGPTGLLEKELVLDVSLRLGSLIEKQMGAEVIYTRDDDRYIALEERPRIANVAKADLFLSIHANSSVLRAATGVETYYLSFTTSKDALEVAARENASSTHRVSELRDLLQKIALKDKVDESREFASRLLPPLVKASTVNTASAQVRNRGVKKAPFIVLIGANMPSVLAEIGFVSNVKDEQNMKKEDQRQKLAEALMRGIVQYAESLSHFQVAKRASADE